jgi:hypothetical protein
LGNKTFEDLQAYQLAREFRKEIFAGRDGGYSKFEPIIVWTSQIGQTFLDAYELLGNHKHLSVGDSVRQWILALLLESSRRLQSFHLGLVTAPALLPNVICIVV